MFKVDDKVVVKEGTQKGTSAKYEDVSGDVLDIFEHAGTKYAMLYLGMPIDDTRDFPFDELEKLEE